ncbi:MAG TPA: DUF6431 domain-containing protein [Candidatus Methylacidiphilales bacterium]|jgi:hypothetical protein|nr:DUF6431 domain-containing protein [Candidatus Methylacidiphilales bacterium]
MQIIHAIDIDPEQYVAEEHEKQIRPPIQCPHCRRAKTLWALGYYIRNLSRMEAGALHLSVRRFRCRVCGKTVSLLPAFAQPYRFVQNRTIEYFARGAPFSDEVSRHLDVLVQYWNRFSGKLSELERTLGHALGRAPPKNPKEAWEFLLAHYDDLDMATQNLTSLFQITLFGRYRCHRPNGPEEK